jgi:hypothetical protein
LSYQVQEWVGNFSAAEHLLAFEGGLCVMEFVFVSGIEQIPSYVNLNFHL